MAALSAEIQFAQRLAANEKKTRDKALKKLRKYIRSRSASKTGLSEADSVKLWKGLHYCMWMQDKPLLQEELAVHISRLLFSFSNIEGSLSFFKVFLVTEAREWNGIDRLRMDKFMMLVRQMFNQTFVLLKQEKWKDECIEKLVAILNQTLLNTTADNIPDSLGMHLADVFIPELTKVGWKQLDGKKILSFLKVFDSYLQIGKRHLVLKRIMASVYDTVVEQTKERVRQAAIKEAELDSGDKEDQGTEDEEDEDSGYDEDSEPRLKYDSELMADHLFEIGSSDKCCSTNRQKLYNIVKCLRDAVSGNTLSAEDEREEYDPDADFDDAVMRLDMLNVIKKKRKQKRKDEEEEEDDIDNEANVPETMEVKSGKNKKKKKQNLKEEDDDEIDAEVNVSDTMEVKTGKSKKRKQKLKKEDDEIDIEVNVPEVEPSQGKMGKSKNKRKRKLRDNKENQCWDLSDVKKVKLVSSDDSKVKSDNVNKDGAPESDTPKKKKKKKKKKKAKQIQSPHASETETKGDNSAEVTGSVEVSNNSNKKLLKEGKLKEELTEGMSLEKIPKKKSKKKKKKKTEQGEETGVSPPKKMKSDSQPNKSLEKDKKQQGENKTPKKSQKAEKAMNKDKSGGKSEFDKPLEEGEVEIWVPNRTYQDKVKVKMEKVKEKLKIGKDKAKVNKNSAKIDQKEKGIDVDDMQVKVNTVKVGENMKLKSKKKSISAFAHFEKISTPPATFVKKAMAKVSKTPSKTPSVTPSKTPSMTPSKTPDKTQSDSISKTPGKTPAKTPGKTPGKTPSRTPAKTPGKTPSRTPAKTPSRTPANTPMKKSDELAAFTPQMTASEKKVKFNMKKNTAQKFEDSISISPLPAFVPTKSPVQGILKSPLPGTPVSGGKSDKKKKKKKKLKTSPGNTPRNTPVSIPRKTPVSTPGRTPAKTPGTGKKALTRSRASDFF